MKPAKTKRSKNLELLNAALRGDFEKVRQFVNRKKSPLRLIFLADRDHPGRYTLISEAPEHSGLAKKMLFTQNEALQLAEDYNGVLFIDVANQSVSSADQNEIKKLVAGMGSDTEKIIVSTKGSTTISDPAAIERAKAKGERVKIKVIKQWRR